MALTGIETGILRAAGKAVSWIVPKARASHQRRDIRDNARALTPLAIGHATIAELDGDRQAKLAAFIATPDFEQLALQLAVAATQVNPVRDGLQNSVQTELWHGLKRALDVKEDLLYRVREVVFDALSVSITVPANMAMGEPATALSPAAVAHLATAAVRNGEILGRIGDLAETHRLATVLRGQAAAAHAEIRLPHTGVNKAVPWPELYVEPKLLIDTEVVGPETPVSPLSLLEPASRTVILGDPGAGKSTLTEKLAYDVATMNEYQRVPFRVVLRDLSASLHTGKLRLVDHLAATARDPYNVAMESETVEYLLLNGRGVVILDGLDELTDVGLRSRMVRLIESFATLYPTAPMVVTSRRIGYREAPLHPDMFTPCRVAPMATEQVAEYSGNWFALDDSLPPVDRDRLHKAFMSESASIADLRCNPLLLSLLCATYSAERYIPRKRAHVYEKCAMLIFERWDSMRGIKQSHRFNGHVRNAVQELAWRLFTESGTGRLPRSGAKKILIDHLRAKGFDQEDADTTADDFLDFCAGRAWVLAEIGSARDETVYGFAHRTFLEYFAAEHLVRHHPDPADVWSALEAHITEGSWEVVSQLALQLLDRNRHDGADTLLGIVLDSGGDHERSAFLARVCAELTLAPNLLRRITDAAVAASRTIPQDQRTPFWLTDLHGCQAADQPLASLLQNSLDGNLPHIRRHLSGQISSAIELGDPFLPVLCDALAGSLDERHREWLRDRRRRTLLRPEVGSLYQWRLSFRLNRNPVAAALIAHSHRERATSPELNLHSLAGRLMLLPFPWLPRTRWLRDFRAVTDRRFMPQFAADSPARDIGPRLVIGLPYLETAAEIAGAEVIDVPFHVGRTLVEMRRTRAPDLPLPPHNLPPDILDFLLRWARHEFSVIG